MNAIKPAKESYPTEQELVSRVEHLRESAPDSTELVDAILAYVETKWFEPDVSMPLIQEALDICERIDYRLGKAKTQILQAEATYIQTRYEESLPLVADAIPVLLEHNAKKEYCWTLLLTSAVSQATGAYDAALEHGFKALEMANEMGVREVSAWMNYRISDIYRELGDYANMLEFAQTCYDRFEELYALSHRRQHLIGGL